MADINLEIGLNFPDRAPDDTNLGQIDVENALDERRLSNTSLGPLVSAIVRTTRNTYLSNENDAKPTYRSGLSSSRLR